MTEALERAFKDAQTLPDQEQLELAEMIEQRIAEMHWEKLLAQPQSQTMLRQLADEAIAEDEAGLTQESRETW